MFVGGGGGSRENWRRRGDGYCVVEGTRLRPAKGWGGGCTETVTVFTRTRYRKRVSTVGIGYLGRV